MLKIKTLVLCALALVTTAATADSTNFFLRANRMGCGTITLVRDVNQAPLYDQQYELLVGGKGSSSTVMGAAVQLDLVGVLKAAVVGAAIDAARGPSTAQGGVKPVEGGVWKDVKAVRVQMDDGTVMNLPMTAQPKLSTGPKYEEGRRVTVFLIPAHSSIQLAMAGRQPPPEDKTYAGWCSNMVEPAVSEAAMAAAASLVQEDKIVQ